MLMRKEKLVPAELATTTFGPINDYVAANDNRPVDESGASTGFEVPRPPSSDNGQYIGLTRNEPYAPARSGDFMQTFTGRKYWPMDPLAEEIFIEDIAHSLSLQCRYAGHCVKFYSVAEHSVLIARHLAATHAPEIALAGLLHDAPETYLVDVPRPVKPFLGNYKVIEQLNWSAVAERFGVSSEMPEAVHDADNRIIGDELVNLVPMDWHARYINPLGVQLRFWSPEKAEEEFLATFEALTGRIGRVAA